MGKAEERALERFPVHKGASKEWIGMHLKGVCAEYIEGYQQAEKDNELTWEDIRKIVIIYENVLNDKDFNTLPIKDGYQEVLKRFNKERKEK